MKPLIVAIVGSSMILPRVLTRLRGRLIRRGFRVELARTNQRAFGEEKDIILIPASPKKVDHLADKITQEWTEQWTHWYAKQKRKATNK